MAVIKRQSLDYKGRGDWPIEAGLQRQRGLASRVREGWYLEAEAGL